MSGHPAAIPSCASSAQGDAEPSGARRPRFETEAAEVEVVYEAADALLDAYRAIRRIAFDKRPAVDALVDQPVYPGDFDALAKALKALADEWRGELDAEPY